MKVDNRFDNIKRASASQDDVTGLSSPMGISGASKTRSQPVRPPNENTSFTKTTGKFVQTSARQAMRDITNEHDNFTPAWWVPIFAILGAALWVRIIGAVL